jgi:Na+/melibiose symporter-like transporter
MRVALQSARLRRVLAAYVVNRLGSWFGLLALAVAVFDHTHSALAVAGLLLAGEALPAFLVMPVVARLESNHGGEITGLYWFEAAVTAALAVLVGNFWLPAILVLVAVDGTAALAASALLRARVAGVAREEASSAQAQTRIERDEHASGDEQQERLVHEAERHANAALNVAFSMTFVLGPVLGGALVAAAGAPAALLIDVGSFLIGGALLTKLVSRSSEAPPPASALARLSDAWQHINRPGRLRRLLIVEVIALIFIQTGGPIEVTFVKSTLHAGDRGLGILLAAWGGGSVVGSVVFARLVRRPLSVLMSAGTLAIAVAYIGLALAPTLALACIAGLVGGVGNGMQWPSLISAVQRLTPSGLQGQLMGAAESLSALCLAVGLPLGGLLVVASSPRTAFLIVGVGAGLATLGFTRLSVERSEPTDAASRSTDGERGFGDRTAGYGSSGGTIAPPPGQDTHLTAATSAGDQFEHGLAQTVASEAPPP